MIESYGQKKAKNNVNRKYYFKFLRLYACQKRLFIFYSGIIILIILNAGFSLVRPELQGEIIDDLSNTTNVEQSKFIFLLFIFLFLLLTNYLMIYIQRYLVNLIAEEIAADLRQKIHDKLATVKADFFSKVEINDILLKIDKDVAAVKQCGITSIMTLISNITILIVVTPYMLSIHKGIAVTNFILLLTIPFVSKLLGQLIEKTSKEVLEGYNSSTRVLNNTYNNWFTVRIFHCYDYVHEKYKKENQKYKRFSQKQKLLYALNTIAILFVQFIGTAIIWIFGAKEVFNGHMTIGTIMALTNYQAIITNPILGIADFVNEYHTALISLKDLSDLIEYTDENFEKGKIIKSISSIRLDHVNFSYLDSDKVLFNNISITFQKGKVYAIHGKSGQGKSTLFKLLTGIYQPTKGRILINDFPLKDFNINDFWKHIGYVMQRSSFFTDSILNNIELFRKIDMSQILEIADLLDLKEEIQSLPEKWNTEIKVDPYNLSEGQMRRLDIMRNVLKESDVLILDEATANIDEYRRKKFYKLLHFLSKHKIIIYATHNLNELTEADYIIDLDK